MAYKRIIPCLLLKDKGLVKGSNFKNHKYVGDPINAIQIFNSKCADEILFLDITATKEGRSVHLDLIEKISEYCWTPFAVGGGIKTFEEARNILKAGAEKVCLNTAALTNPTIVKDIAKAFGSQSIMVSIDYKYNWRGKLEIYTHCGTKLHQRTLHEVMDDLQNQGVGEIILNCIERDGKRNGYDLAILNSIQGKYSMPIILSGGAGSYLDIKKVFENSNVSVAAGSLFVLHGKLEAVLISYPDNSELKNIRGEI